MIEVYLRAMSSRMPPFEPRDIGLCAQTSIVEVIGLIIQPLRLEYGLL